MNDTVNSRINSAEVISFLKRFRQSGEVFEIRIPEGSIRQYGRPPGVYGYFRYEDIEGLPSKLAALNSAATVYVTLNPVDPRLYARTAGQFAECDKKHPQTSDTDIVKRSWLLIDVDPVRPSDIPASEEEVIAAIEMASRIRDFLAAAGWSEPIEGLSANGGHLLYSIHLPADDGGLVTRILSALGAQFDTADRKVDQTVFNPSRVTKLFGTFVSGKGASVPDMGRVHRMARVIHMPDDIKPVPRELLEALAGVAGQQSGNTTGGKGNQQHTADTKGAAADKIWMADWLKTHTPEGTTIIGPDSWQSGGWRWVLTPCPWNDQHTDNSAFVVIRPTGEIGAGCQHNGCADKDWRALRILWEPGYELKSKVGREINYLWETVPTDKGKHKNEVAPRPYDETVECVLTLSQGRLLAVDAGHLFARPETAGAPMILIRNEADLFGYLGVLNKCSVDWRMAPGCMTRAEALSSVRRKVPVFRNVEIAPHWPPMSGLYYNVPELPPPDYDALIALLGRFCPETEQDIALILALFLTAVWGGPEGQRPTFLIISRDGRGVGKTTIGESAAYLLGQDAIAHSTKSGDMSKLVTRLLSPAAVSNRVVIFDNETGRVSSAELASLVTCRTISGQALYVGEGRRPNNLLWVITLNSPSLDSDLASRCIPIAIRKPKFSPSWKSEMESFIREHRLGILSALVATLKEPSKPIRICTRWGLWESAVLSRCTDVWGTIAELQKLIGDRQRAFDDEADEVGLIRDGFLDAARQGRVNLDMFPAFYSNSVASVIYNEATGSRVRKNTALRAIRELIRCQTIPELQEHRSGKHGRGFLWVSATAAIGEEAIHKVTVEFYHENEPY